jgi:2-polyprenyl-3-methyl-5-hydroxy-6-metoxy-1,4-benzoquinol methylase
VSSYQAKDHLIQEQPSCILCGARCKSELAGLFDDRYGAPGTYDIRQCRRCGLEQTWPQPSEEDLKELYESFYNWGGDGATAYSRLRERFLASGLYRGWLRVDGDMSFHLRRGHGRLLDVGCNEGRGLMLYRRSGFQAEGLELNTRAAAVARQRGFAVYTQPLAQFVPSEPYQVVVLAHVLEHATDPVAMLVQVRRLLQPGGQIWLSCPNAASFWRQVFGRHWISWHVPYHLWHFSAATLQTVLARAQLRLVELTTATPALWLTQSLCSRLGGRAGQTNRLMRCAPLVAGLMLATRGLLFPWLGHLNRRMVGDCLIAIARI